jgi:hypothetical protein
MNTNRFHNVETFAIKSLSRCKLEDNRSFALLFLLLRPHFLKKSLKQKSSSWFWVSLHDGQCKKNQHGILLVSFYQQSFQILEMSHDNVVDRSSVSFQLILTPTVHTISMSKFNLDNGRALHKESMGIFVNTESQALSLFSRFRSVSSSRLEAIHLMFTRRGSRSTRLRLLDNEIFILDLKPHPFSILHSRSDLWNITIESSLIATCSLQILHHGLQTTC